MSIADPNAPRLFVELTVEPFTGWRTFVARWERAASPGEATPEVAVSYDGVPVATQTARVTTGPDGRRRFDALIPVPVEAGSRRVSVSVGGEAVFDAAWDEIGPPPGAAGPGRAERWLSPGRWFARSRRLIDRARFRLLRRRYRPWSPHDGYVRATALTPPVLARMRESARRFRYRPTVSILMPVYDVEPRWLDAAIASVRAQIYDDWELCLADDASTLPALRRYLDRLPSDPRIKLTRRAENGHISAATNTAADSASGEFVALMDNDDLLSPDALFEVVARLQERPDADLIYSDEDKIDESGRRYDPQFKPDWSPELFLAYNYVNHFTVVRRSVFEQAGRFRIGYEGSQDHDMLLRVVGLTDRVEHVPKILYHWRSLPGSTAAAATVKPFVHTSGRRALADHLQRHGIGAVPYQPEFARKLGLPIVSYDWPDDGPAVAVVPLTPDGHSPAPDLSDTSYRNFRVADRADALDEELILFLDPRLEPTDPRWLSRLVGYLGLSGVGAAGPSLVAADGSRIASGVLLGMRDGTAPANAFLGLPQDAVSYYFQAEVTRNVSAVGAECLLTRRRHLEELGGLGPLGGVDYCARLAEAGLRVVCVGEVSMRRPDVPTATREQERADDPVELVQFRRRYGRPRDRHYNPNLSQGKAFARAADGPLPEVLAERSPRALVVTHNLNPAEGAPRCLTELVVGMAGRGRLRAEVWSPQPGGGDADYRAAGVPVTVAERPWGQRFIDGRWGDQEYVRAVGELTRLMKQRRPEVLIANTLLAFPAVEAAARAGVPAVWLIHESYTPEQMMSLFGPFARGRCEAAFALAERVIPVSHDTAALFSHLNTRGNFEVIHGAVAVPAHARSAGPKLVLSVGTVCERKGQHVLVEAAARLAREGLDFRCRLVGARESVPYVSYVRHLARRHGIEDRIELIAETGDVWSHYRAADVFVCTSAVEAFSRSILEAEAFGLPIVSTPCCGLGEQVHWGHNALRFDFGDADALATHLSHLLGDDLSRRRMGARSRAAFDIHLNPEEVLDRYQRVVLSAARHGMRGASSVAAPGQGSDDRRAA